MSRWFQKRAARKQRTDLEVRVQSYAPNATLIPQEYGVSEHLAKLEDNFQATVMTFFKNTNVDQFNESYIDGLIKTAEREAIADLGMQRIDHVIKIKHVLQKVWKGDRMKTEEKLAQAQRELNKCEEELHRLEHIYCKGTSMERAVPATE